MTKNLDAVFSPKSIAVIGASSTKGKVGHDIFVNILQNGYTGTLFPVNPGAASISSVKCYKTLLEIPDPIDLAMIILPPAHALKAIDHCVEKKVKAVVIVSAGFKEVGGEGLEIENKIKEKCRDAGIRIVGPNCLGVINPSPGVSLNASFSARMPARGNISFISQSGALCTAVLDFAADRGFGFSKFISIGNKADVDELDLLRYLHNDPDTDVVMIYMEELSHQAEEFITEVREMTSGKNPTPVLAIKSGKSAAGAEAAASHTGSLAGSDAIYDAVFAQAGIIRCDTVNELFDFATAVASGKTLAGDNIAIVTNAGGPGIIATDMTEISGMKLASFADSTVEELKKYLPPTANFNNPVDLIGDAASDRYENALSTVISDRGVDGVLIILTPQSMTDAIGTATSIINIAKRSLKPILCCFMGVVDVSGGVKILQQNNIPVYKFPENAASAMGALYRGTRWLGRKILPQFTLSHDPKKAKALIEGYMAEGKTVLTEFEGASVLKCYGFETLPMQVAADEDQAVKAAEITGYPVVMKIVSGDILHKSDAGAVMLGIETEAALKENFTKIIENARAYKPDAKIEGVLIQKMAPKGVEVIYGASRTPVFGHSIMFGLGGVFVELFKDVIFRIAPLGRNVARRMIRGIKGYPLLTGYRGAPPVDIEKLEMLLVSTGQMVSDLPMIKELDINPLIVYEKGKGAMVADVVITLDPQKKDIV